MAKTEIIYRDIAPGALEHVTPTIDDLQPFCDLNDLKKESISPPQAATLEKDYWRLDGSFEIFPDAPKGQNWGIWSQSMTEADGTFTVPPVLTLTFTELFSSVGLTFSFNSYGPDWCNDMNVKWYRGSTLLAEEDFTPDDWEFQCIHEVKLFNRIVITFRGMSKPYRYLKLQRVVYGIIRAFGPGEFQVVNLFQAASIISEELEINTMDFTLSSKDPVPFMFQRKQPMELYHNTKLQGVFYISSSKRIGERVYEIQSSDLVGLLDENNHMGGIYDNVTFAELAAEILAGYEYEIDAALVDVQLSGWLPIATCRENLTQAAFAVGAVVDTSGSDRVRIFSPCTSPSADFDGERVYAGSNIDTAALVTAVEVTEHKYTADDETQELFNDTLNGTADITFSEPMHTLSITGGTINKSGANYARITGSGGTVVLTGAKYNHTTRTITVNNPDVAAGEVVNVIQVTDVTLVSPGNSESVAQRVYTHYQRRENVNATLILNSELPGDVVTISTEFDGVKTGTILSLDMDIARKKIGEAVILCQ